MTLMSTPDLSLPGQPGAAELAATTPRAHFTTAARPARPRPGVRLAAAVERVLADPTAPTAAAELAAGLAWTAALGETCLLTGAVADVRRGARALAGRDLAAATAALESARADLPAAT